MHVYVFSLYVSVMLLLKHDNFRLYIWRMSSLKTPDDHKTGEGKGGPDLFVSLSLFLLERFKKQFNEQQTTRTATTRHVIVIGALVLA